MMVKEGYKEVQLGPKKIEIPEEWDHDFLNELCDFSQGYQISRKNQITQPRENYVRYLYITDFKSDKKTLYIKDNEKYYHMSEDDIAVANTGSCGEAFRGASGVLSNNMFRIDYKTKEINNNFMFNFLNSKIYKDQLNSILNHTGRPHLGHKNMGNIVIVIPSLSEQKKIASILSSVDKTIEKTDEVIEKTKELKKGLMQQLLTKGIGHDEFKEVRIGAKIINIPTSWEIKNFSDVYKKRSKRYKGENEIKYVGLEHMESGNINLIGYDSNGNSRSSNRVFEKGDILYGKLRPYLDKAAKSKFNGICSTDIIPIYSSNKSTNEYLLYFLHSKTFMDFAISTMEGTNLPRTSWRVIKNLTFPLPPIEEQKKIAAILSSVDKKIQKEEEYKEKLEELKKGLMQKLLTGEVRVKVAN